MKRHIVVEVRNRKELAALEAGLAEPEVRAFVLTVGYLLPFKPEARARILTFLAGGERFAPAADALEDRRVPT